jgi:hypothetical protein
MSEVVVKTRASAQFLVQVELLAGGATLVGCVS